MRPKLQRLSSLQPGDSFSIPGTELRGVVVALTSCSVSIKRHVDPKLIQFKNKDGSLREFVAEQSGIVQWALGTEVLKEES
jgi:hypothetical protein